MKRPSYVAALGESYLSARSFRVAYMAGPGDVTAVMRLLAAGDRDLTNSHVGYSELMIRACQEAGVTALLALTTHPDASSSPARFNVGGLEVTVMRMPNYYEGKRGWRFHAACWYQADYLRAIVAMFRADVLVTGDDPPRAAALKSLRRSGCKIVRAHHCAITPIKQPPGLLKRMLLGLAVALADGVFDAVLSASRQVSDQARALWGSTPIVEFLPHFDEELHRRVTPLPPLAKSLGATPWLGGSLSLHSDEPELRCVYVGRIERSKGVFDLLDAAMRCAQSGARVSFDLCGDGTAFEELKAAAARAEVWGVGFRLHGRCNREQMQAIIARAHLGVVPTRSEFVEGFAQVVVEHMLNGRPVVATDAVPGASYARNAVSIVPCDNPLALANELVSLFHTPMLLQHKHEACAHEAEKFLWPHTSYAAAMAHTLRALAAGERVTERRVGFNGSVSQ